MAKAQAGKTGGVSRVRFIMVEAELADGDVGQMMTTLQNALQSKPQVVVQRIASPAKPAMNGHAAEVDEIDDTEVEDAVEVETAAPQRSSAPAKPRTFKAPDVVPLELDAPVSLVEFAADKNADSNHKKFLLCAVYLKEHRGIDAVDMNHIYTCFRKLGWSTGIADFSQPLRELKTRKFFTSPERGKYVVNHIGVDTVKKLANGTGG